MFGVEFGSAFRDASFLLGSAARRPLALDEDSVAAPFAAIARDGTEPARTEARVRARDGR
jgi:hypothetical protein